ncbi:MAG: ATPase [Pseudomonadota bacterium]
MPQLDQALETLASQIFWLAVFFGITYFLIGRGMVPKIMGTVELRDNQIAGDLAAARTARDAADQQEEAWRVRESENRAAAQAYIADAKAKAASSSEAKLAKAQAQLDEKLALAETEIEAARASAMEEIESVAVDAARDIVVRVAGGSVTEAAARKAVKEALADG